MILKIRHLQLELKTDSQSTSQPAFNNVEKCTQCNILPVIFNFGDIRTFLVDSFGKLFLGHIELFARTFYLETDTKCFQFVLKPVALGRADFTVIFSLDLIECLYIFHKSLFLSLK